MPKKLTQQEFIKRCQKIHSKKYDYTKTIYNGSKNFLTISCPIHGDFIQKAEIHLYGCGCPKCDPTNILGNNKFIEKANQIHNNKFDYSLVKYVKNNIPVDIICHIHGTFSQIPGAHLRGQGCPKCCNNKKRTTEDFIKLAKIKHGDKYDYSLVDYKNKRTKIKIICQKHGIFLQTPYVHLDGFGCKLCKSSRLEKYLSLKLQTLNIEYTTDKKFDKCRNKLPLSFDFYLPKINTLIECDGIQHYKPLKFFGGEERFEQQKINDNIKNKYCIDNNIKLIRVKNCKEIDELFFI